MKYHSLDSPNGKYGSCVPTDAWNVFYRKKAFHLEVCNKVHNESTLGVTSENTEVWVPGVWILERAFND